MDSLNLDMVKNEYLKVDHDAEDMYINLLIKASKSFVETYLNLKIDDFGEDYPSEFDIARLQLIGQWYEDRVIMSPRSNVHEMRYVFADLLDPHRNWQIAFVEHGGRGNEVDGYKLYDEYQKELSRFYLANVVDTHTAIKGNKTPPESTAFYAPKDSVDYNQRWRRDDK